MEKIFLIEACPSDFDSHPVIIGFVISEEEAKSIVEKKKELYLKALELNEKIIDKVYALAAKQDKQEPYHSLIEIPRWISGIAKKDITEEMRAVRNRIKEENEIIQNKNSIISKRRASEQAAIRKNFIDSADEELKVFFDTNNYFILDHLNEKTPYSFFEVEKIEN